MRKQIDSLLHDNSVIQSNLGMESTKSERLEAKEKEKVIKEKIGELDEEFSNYVFIED